MASPAMSDFRLIHDGPQSVEWETPPDLFRRLDEEFHFDLDPCASATNAKCEKYFTCDDNGLAQSWADRRVFMNPPYGRVIGSWLEKAYRESQKHGTLVVCLVFARTETGWWHDYCMKGEVRFLRGRIKFVGGRWNAPSGSAIVIFRPK